MEDIIEHHGVKGQKWGVRRKAAKAARVAAKVQKKDSVARAKSWNKAYQTRSKMSDSELRSAVNRLQLENQFAQQAAIASAGATSSGKKYIARFANQTMNAAAGQASQALAKKAIKSAIAAAS